VDAEGDKDKPANGLNLCLVQTHHTIYLDASHRLIQAQTDVLLSWPLY